MPIFTDPTSPVGKTIPLQPSDIGRLRKSTDDRFVADKAYNLDPQFRMLADHYFKPEISSQLDDYTRQKLPTMLLNMHYFGKPELEQTDDLTAHMAQEMSAPSTSVFSTMARAATGFLPEFGGSELGKTISAPTKLGAGLIGKGVEAMGIPGVSDIAGGLEETQSIPENFERTGNFVAGAAPIAAGIATAGMSIPASAAITGISGATGSVAENTADVMTGQDVSAGEFARDAVISGLLEGAVQAGTLGFGRALMPAKGAKLASNAQELVQPKGTSKVLKDAAAKNPELVQKGLMRTTLAPDTYQKQLAETVKQAVPEFGRTTDPIQNGKLVQQTIKQRASALREAMKANNAALSRKEIGSVVKARVQDVSEEFGDQPGVFESTRKIWEKLSAKHPGTIEGQWQARIDFYEEVEKRFGATIFEKGNARAEAVRAIGQAANDSIEDAAKRAGVSYKSEIDTLSQLYDVRQALSTKIEVDGPVKKAIKSPLGRTAGGVAIGATGYNLISQ